MNFNDEEYKSIREARLALLSVGDPVYYITFTHHIETWYVIQVLKDAIRVDTGAVSNPTHYFDNMEMYEGNLYISGYRTSNRKIRYRRMVKTIRKNERGI